ncbi:MAG: hypothetical protein ACLTGI_05300 [Hoylesella buccalis]
MKGNFVSEAEKKEWLAESKFLIAYYHFATLRRYGPIPITDSYVAMDTYRAVTEGLHFDYCVDWIAKLLDELLRSSCRAYQERRMVTCHVNHVRRP